MLELRYFMETNPNGEKNEFDCVIMNEYPVDLNMNSGFEISQFCQIFILCQSTHSRCDKHDQTIV